MPLDDDGGYLEELEDVKYNKPREEIASEKIKTPTKIEEDSEEEEKVEKKKKKHKEKAKSKKEKIT